jgi:signal transduction histidine kinase
MRTADSGLRRTISKAVPQVLGAVLDAFRHRSFHKARSLGQGVGALEYVAHELRTPLAVLRGYVSMIEDGTYPVPTRTRDEVVAIIAAKAQELDS